MKSQIKVYLAVSTKKGKKYTVKIHYPSGRTKTVHFGAKGMSDFTKHKDIDRKKRYIARHKARENWNKSGIDTAGFWSRWLLWNKPTLRESIKAIEQKFSVRIKRMSRI